MNLLIGFAPFLTFAAASHLAGVLPGLLAGTAVSAALVAREMLRHRSPKLLELGTLLLLATLSLYAVAAAPTWTVMQVRLLVDTGLLVIVIGSLLAGKPFTGQYAREQASADLWETPQFIGTNRRITFVWAIAFLVLVLADFLLVFAPAVAPQLGIALTIAALFWAMRRTRELTRTGHAAH